MQTARIVLALVAAGSLGVGCGGGSTSGAHTGGSGLGVPQEISALPTSDASPAARAAARSPSSSSLAATSDYETTPTFKFVDERSLSQFDILNTIFRALAQTHYADGENLGAGPYGAMVSWIEDKGDSQMKMIKSWVVSSAMDGEVNRVRVWMRNMMDGGGPAGMAPPPVIQADLRITQAPTQRADGSYADYGVWTLSVDFMDGSDAYFAASATHDTSGVSIVMLHQHFPGEIVRGILYRADAQGFGRVEYPDWNDCHADPCTPTDVTVSYAYDPDHVALRKGDAPVVFKDRTNTIDLVNRYGLYDATTGADIAKSHSFGFPIQYADDTGTHYGYYGAWQGRQQLWTNGQDSLPAGSTVTRQDHASGAPASSYTTSPPYTGILVRRTMSAADLDDLTGLVSQTWINEGFNLAYDGSGWTRCTYAPGAPPTCTAFGDFGLLVADPANPLQSVNINRWNQVQGQPENLVYVDGTFYVATSSLPPTSTGVPYVPATNDQLWVNLNGAIYISYDGAGWVQKKVVSFDQSTSTPSFDDAQDAPFTLELGRQYYINGSSVNYVVTRTATSAYDVKVELQDVANPVNASAFVAGVEHFRPQWADAASASTFRFDTDPGSGTFLKLIYDTVGSQDASAGIAVGDVLTQGQWGLVACNAAGDPVLDGEANSLQFNWDYPQNCQNCGGVQQFLLDGATYVMLDDPIRLAPITLTNHHGDSRTVSLQFDGSWVNGLPDVYRDLQQNGFDFTPAIADKVVAIPSGTEVVDAATPAHRYLFKQLQVQEYLAVIADPGGLDLSQAAALDLSAVPGYVDNGMGTIPDVPVKYSEGVLVR